MANGYPTRSHEPPPMPDGLVPDEVCIICKRRPAKGGTFCGPCGEALTARS